MPLSAERILNLNDGPPADRLYLVRVQLEGITSFDAPEYHALNSCMENNGFERQVVDLYNKIKDLPPGEYLYLASQVQANFIYSVEHILGNVFDEVWGAKKVSYLLVEVSQMHWLLNDVF